MATIRLGPRTPARLALLGLAACLLNLAYCCGARAAAGEVAVVARIPAVVEVLGDGTTRVVLDLGGGSRPGPSPVPPGPTPDPVPPIPAPNPTPKPLPDAGELESAARAYIDAKPIGYGLVLPGVYRELAGRVESGTLASAGAVAGAILDAVPRIDAATKAAVDPAAREMGSAFSAITARSVAADGLTITDPVGYADALRRMAGAMEAASRGK